MMKIIQAMKKLKDLAIKAQDLRDKIAKHSADLSMETPAYEDQKTQVANWLQAHGDVLKEILRLRLAIQRTNLATNVTIELGGVQVTKCIAEWVHRRRDLAKLDMESWSKLTDRGLKDQRLQTIAGGPVTEITVRRYFDSADRDQHIELYRSEPSLIDGTLEVVNATTDLIEV